MINNQSVIVRKLAETSKAMKQAYRFIHNKKLKPENILTEHWRTRELDVSGRHLLVVGDTTTITMCANKNRKDLPLLTQNSDKNGFHLHACIMLDADSGGAYGVGAVHTNTDERVPESEEDKEKQLERRKKVYSLPLEQKERAKWFSVPKEAIKNCAGAARYTLVGDREADIYDLMAKGLEQEWDFVYRSNNDRIIEEDEGLLYKFLESREVSLCHQVSLPATKKRSAHSAWLDIKHGEVTIRQPRYKKDKSLPAHIKCYVVEAKEQERTVVGKEKAIHWIILSSHPVTDAESALQILKWYTLRWVIEQVFRTMKKEGLDVENSELEDLHGLEVLVSMACIAALSVIQLVQARNGKTQDQTEQVFSKEGEQLLAVLNEKLQGQTEKQKNPYAKESLAYASWVIARLGGWSGYASERPPGPITMIYGLNRFFDMLSGYIISQRLVT